MQGTGKFIGYKSRDFALYVLSLGLVGAASSAVFRGSVALQAIVWAALVYLAVVFVYRRGVERDPDFFGEVGRGIAGYPAYLRLMWSHASPKIKRLGAVFLAGLAVEQAAFLLAGKRDAAPTIANGLVAWAHRPFNWVVVVAIHFAIIEIFRAAILYSHVAKRDRVRAMLDESKWAKFNLRRMGTVSLCVHGYVTGAVAHLCLYVPYIAFWELTRPTNLREVAMFAASVVVMVRRRHTVSPDLAIQDREFLVAHEMHHRSRFGFTVFHGQHHDTIPSALIGASGGAAFVENLDRGLYRGDVLDSVIVLTLRETAVAIWDMVTHQYIPGVYPYCKFVVQSRMHHVVHHYGSIQPLGEGWANPADDGYKPNNAIARWFLEKVAEHEDITDQDTTDFLASATPLRP